MKINIYTFVNKESFERLKETNSEEAEKQLSLIIIAENKVHPEALIDNVRKIHQDFINYENSNSKVPLLPEFRYNFDFIEKVIRDYEESILKPIIINEENVNNNIQEEYSKQIKCLSLKKSGEKIISAAKEIINSSTDRLPSEKGWLNNIAAWLYESTFGNNKENEITNNIQSLQEVNEGFVILNLSPQLFDVSEVKAGGEQ